MRFRSVTSLLVAIAALTIFSTQLTHAATIVNIDATSLGLADGTVVPSIANSGTAGVFTTVTGSVEVASHPSNSGIGPLIQGLGFGGDKMASAVDTPTLGLVGNQVYSISAWVWNPAIAAEEAIVAWGRRNGPDGSNVGFHQGTNTNFGAVGHWGSPDIGYGNGGADINATTGRWTNLAHTWDGTTTRVYIDGVLNNQEDIAPLVVHGTLRDNTPLKMSLGSENDRDNPAGNPIAFSGTIAQVFVSDTVLSDADITGMYDAGVPLFVEGIPEPGSFVLAVMGLMSLVALRRRRRR